VIVIETQRKIFVESNKFYLPASGGMIFYFNSNLRLRARQQETIRKGFKRCIACWCSWKKIMQGTTRKVKSMAGVDQIHAQLTKLDREILEDQWEHKAKKMPNITEGKPKKYGVAFKRGHANMLHLCMEHSSVCHCASLFLQTSQTFT